MTTLKAVTLDDKYLETDGDVLISGSQTIVRLAMMQMRRDRAAGLNTACYITGYRGSPMHNVDKDLWRCAKLLPELDIHFQPAINEDLAATACWGSQQAAGFGDAKFDGVAALWYGKGPGLDRSIDAIRHGHMAGASSHGGVLVAVGDDHPLSSTDSPAAHEVAFMDLQMPVLYPADVGEILEYGLYGWAMSRFSGAWVGLKLIPDTVDATAPIGADPFHPHIAMPNVDGPADGVNLRIPDYWYDQEPRLRTWKVPRALDFARANQLNRVILASPKPRYGIITTGKATHDVRQALLELGLDDAKAADLGITVLKIAMPYPFDTETVRAFATGLEEVFVVEEKQRFTEMMVRDALYTLPDGRRPRVIGQSDEQGNELLPLWPEISAEPVTRALAGRIAHFHASDRIEARLAFLEAKAEAAKRRQALSITRLPYFCSGCPHNSSTRVPEGSRAQGGVGCHFMATYMDRGNITHTHMGGEGVNWVGQAPFVETKHVFQNMGDGTYFHSGILAIRAAIAADANITYKILFNDAVAMTGGQPHDGVITPWSIANQVRAEGVERIVVVSDEPDKYPIGVEFPKGAQIEHRKALDRVQRDLREWPGVSVLIYDQTCAAEKRRRRKRGAMIDPDRRLFINTLVCEGCGDCNRASNCMSVLPVDTAFGRKRMIDQSACNKDYSCVEGFCPSFVSVYGGTPRRQGSGGAVPAGLRVLPEPERPPLRDDAPYSILVTGVGGTGVVTIGALITMAAHLEGCAFSSIDQFGMAQKGGAVMSHIRLAARPEAIRAVRLNAGAADLVLGCDSLVAGGDVALSTMAPDKTRVILNTYEQITGHFTRDPDLRFPSDDVVRRIRAAVGDDALEAVDVSRLATRLMGDAIAANLFMLGLAYQRGLIPVSAAAIERAIELNGVAVAMNKSAFVWGRRAARDLAAVAEAAAPRDDAGEIPRDLDGLIVHRARELTAYQNAGYADRYRARIAALREAEARALPGQTALAEAAARYLYKLMAVKDEYEVARLFSDGRFRKALRAQFDGNVQLRFHMAPPILSTPDPETGRPKKRAFGAWMARALPLLAALKGLRGGPLDPFRLNPERKLERRLLADYEALLDEIAAGLDTDNHAHALALASLPENIRGYGHVKQQHIQAVEAEKALLLQQWREPATRAAAE